MHGLSILPRPVCGRGGGRDRINGRSVLPRPVCGRGGGGSKNTWAVSGCRAGLVIEDLIYLSIVSPLLRRVGLVLPRFSQLDHHQR